MPFLFQQGLFDEPEAVAGEAGKVEEFGPQNVGKTGEHLEFLGIYTIQKPEKMLGDDGEIMEDEDFLGVAVNWGKTGRVDLGWVAE